MIVDRRCPARGIYPIPPFARDCTITYDPPVPDPASGFPLGGVQVPHGLAWLTRAGIVLHRVYWSQGGAFLPAPGRDYIAIPLGAEFFSVLAWAAAPGIILNPTRNVRAIFRCQV